MEIRFRTKKLRNLCSNSREMTRKLGDQVAGRMKDLLFEIWSSDSLADLSRVPGARPHPLKGERSGQFAVDVTRSVRIVFEPDHDPLPSLPDGGIDRSKITRIRILFVGDYHE